MEFEKRDFGYGVEDGVYAEAEGYGAEGCGEEGEEGGVGEGFGCHFSWVMRVQTGSLGELVVVWNVM